MKAKIFLLTVFLLIGGFSTKNSAQVTYNSAGEEYFQQYQLATALQGKDMSKEEEEKLLKSLTPEVRAKMEEIKKLDKNKYYQLLRSRFPYGVYSTAGVNIEAPEIAGLFNAREPYKKEKVLEIDVELLALKLKNADNGSQQKIKQELGEKLGDLFDMKETQKQEEVQRLEKRLQELKESLKYRKQNKDEIVQRRIQELLGDSKYLRWE
jgi:hypothetical protein